MLCSLYNFHICWRNVVIKKINNSICYLVVTLLFSPLYAGFLTPVEIERAEELAKSPVRFEEFIQPKDNVYPSWLTLEKFIYEARGVKKTVYMANTFSSRFRNTFGELALFRETADLEKIDHGASAFVTYSKTEKWLSLIRYEYKTSPDDLTSYFIIENAITDESCRRQGYSQACVRYFIENFVLTRTDVPVVFSDLRNPATRQYFPQFDFIEGSLQGYTFKRAMAHPFHWKNNKQIPCDTK